MAPAIDIRAVPESDLDRMVDLAGLVFHDRIEARERETIRSRVRGAERIGAYEGDRLVGQLATLSRPLRVPAGDLPAALVTYVGVAPTHRRRGVLSALIERMWADCAPRGEALAVLWAAEAAIYGRFGFGAATHMMRFELRADRPLELRIEPDPAPLRLVEAADAPALLDPLYERARPRRAGQVRRDERWWRDRLLRDKEDDEPERGPPRVVVLGEPGREVGYAIYRVQWGEGEGEGAELSVVELEADTPQAEAALWRYLCSIDLVGTVASGRPLDDALPLVMSDPDRLAVKGTSTALWLRLIDVRAALEARGWAAEVDVVLELSDAALPANAGRWRLRAAPGGASVERTGAPAQLALDVRELGAAYLGGTRIAQLVHAGLAREPEPGAADALDAALRGERAPFTNDHF